MPQKSYKCNSKTHSIVAIKCNKKVRVPDAIKIALKKS